jgi:hypothetical protein
LLGQDVLDLLSLRGVISKLSTNWRQLKQSLREEGLRRDDQSVVDWRGSTPPSQAVSVETISVDNLQGSTPPAVSTENVSQLVVDLQGLTPPRVTAEAGTQSGDVFRGSTPLTTIAESSGHDESIELSTESSIRQSFIGPVIPGDAVKLTDGDAVLNQGQEQ